MEDFIKGLIEGLIALMGFIYRICEVAMPFMIIDIYNKIDEIERKLKK